MLQELRFIIHSTTHPATSEENDNRSDADVDVCRKARVGVVSATTKQRKNITAHRVCRRRRNSNLSAEALGTPSLLRLISHSVNCFNLNATLLNSTRSSL